MPLTSFPANPSPPWVLLATAPECLRFGRPRTADTNDATVYTGGRFPAGFLNPALLPRLSFGACSVYLFQCFFAGGFLPMAEQKKSPGFGEAFTPHMLMQRYDHGAWGKAELAPYQKPVVGAGDGGLALRAGNL